MHPAHATFPPIPADIKRAARAVFSSSNFYIRVGEQAAAIFSDGGLAHLAETGNSLKTAPHFLPLVTFFQFVEGLTDAQAADAVRSRMDWKFALHLPLHLPIFSPEILCEFRRRVIIGPENQAELQVLVDRLAQLNPPIHPPEEAYEVIILISSICSMNCLENIQHLLSDAIGALAIGFPQELRRIARPDWYGRYNPMASGSHPNAPARLQDMWIRSFEIDIPHLLEEVEKSDLPEIKTIPEIVALEQVWFQRCEKWQLCIDQSLSNLKLCHCEFCGDRRRGVMGGTNNLQQPAN
jgi:hypothetical protein